MNRMSTNYAKISDPDCLLHVNNLTVNYRGGQREVTAVRDVTLSLGRGETMGIIGESGSGKTSIAMAVLGLIGKPHQVYGEVLIGGQNILALPEGEQKQLRWRKVALVFQNSLEVLNPVLRVGEQIGEPMKRHLKISGSPLLKEIDNLMALVGLDPYWQEAYPHQLSGGMRQRVLLAMALSCRPDLLLIDEPTTSLDAVARKGVVEMLQRLQKELCFGMIVITHDLATVSTLTERLLVLYNGEIMESGKTAEVIEKPWHPYTRGLLNASVELFPHKDLWGIPGEPSLGNAWQGCSFFPRCTQVQVGCTESNPSLIQRPERAVRCHRGGIFTLLSGTDITKNYRIKDKTISALGGVSLEVCSGETVALVGASGSGKSTLAQIMAGYLQPDTGKIFFQGQAVKDGKIARQENGIQLVLQDPFSSLSHRLTVEEAVTEPLLINKLGSPEERKNRVTEALLSVQLPGDDSFLGQFCYMLSGGQRQRLSIARALVMRPALLLADEITSMLDVSTQANLMRLLKGLQNSGGFAMLYITHDLHLARKVAERIIVLHHGMITEEGSAKRVTEYTCCQHTRKLLDAGLHDH